MRSVSLTVQLCPNHTSEVTEPIDTKNKGTFTRLGRIAAEPGHCERSRDVYSREEDTQRYVLPDFRSNRDGEDKTNDADHQATQDMITSFLEVIRAEGEGIETEGAADEGRDCHLRLTVS
jgi:hypothetical protein